MHNQKLPLNNLRLYRLHNFVGRTKELTELKTWFNYHPVVAITGPSGAGKSTLATALAVSEASRFEQGIVWISATGYTTLNFYDIIRDVDRVLGTGITRQPVSSWPILALQQLYGFSRLLIMDELADADETTVQNIMAMISQIGPGGPGRFILIGRHLPPTLQESLNEANLVLSGLSQTEVKQWVINHQTDYPLTLQDTGLLHRITGGHPLALKLIAGLWKSKDLPQLVDLVSAQAPEDWESRLKTTVTSVLAFLHREYPQGLQLLINCSLASGGFSIEAIKQLYWVGEEKGETPQTIIQNLLKRGLVMHNPNSNRYFIHPLVRRFLDISPYLDKLPQTKSFYAINHTRYYLKIAHKCTTGTSFEWETLDNEWGNIRTAINFLVSLLQNALNISIESFVDIHLDNLPTVPPTLKEVLILIQDYIRTLNHYIFWRRPPNSAIWLTSALIATRQLKDQSSEALISNCLADLAYFHHNYPTAQMWIEHSLSLYQTIQDYTRIIHIHRDLGTILAAQDKFDEALETYETALDIAIRHGTNLDQAALNGTIAGIYYRQQNYRQALVWYHQALEFDIEENKEIWQAVYYNNISLALEATGNYRRAVEYYTKAIELCKAVDYKKGLSTSYSNLGAVCYQLDELEEALQWYEKDMAIMDGLGNWFDVAAILHNMGYVALELDKLKIAATYFMRSRDIYRQFGQNDLAHEEEILMNTIIDRHTLFG